MTALKPTQQWLRLASMALATSLALTACGNKVEEMKKEQMAKMKELQPEISVLTVQPENVLLETHLPGRLESLRTANIMPQVSGVVTRRLFREGSNVQAGQPLYEIDDATHQANLQSAQASLLSAQAALSKANTDVERFRPLVQADAISKQEWDAALAAKMAAEAQIASAKAAINAAKVSLNYTRVFAPISGYIGQSAVSEGTLVNANTTLMATITQNDPIYVNITQSSADMLKLNQQLLMGQKVRNPEVVMSLMLEDGSIYPRKGRLLFSNATVDEKTGQVTIRGAIDNPEGLLMSGMYVRVNLPLAGILGAYLVPQRAVTRGAKDTLTIATDEGKLEQRTVKVSGQKDNNWVITEGLKAGDKVVIDGGTMSAAMLGIQSFKIKEWQPESASPTTYATGMSNMPPPPQNPSNEETETAPVPAESASEAQ